MWTIRYARAGDGPRLRALRLEALYNARSAFLETVEQATAVDEQGWEDRIARCTQPHRQALVAVETHPDEAWLGMAGAFIDSESEGPEFDLPDPPVATGQRWAMVWGTYTDPGHRREGMAAALCTELCRWAAEDAQVDWLGLHVRDTNTAAIRLYQQLGFAVTARRHHPHLDVTSLIMVRATTAGSH
ncbi:GNAT family N-acetyltransferase [Nocardia carnea]|uniref:GNAT family N-acetyltransferase n=1 Tax=Nocardia carnea TaxID=37328 RepID=UPI00052421F3|nr:N-acetyltransferase [Nocardia carnea]